ncbi:MAG: hypothetical protein DF168_01485 [Candidatus Moanabacter tarae]|uniref:Uncharacterized protein n=1 Tax=Candidatus Moanibacter tarae TaxID=2200854 RepID=A0A2Z4ADE6_9BACT|nr:MAG: hypothetical protein DF168_01485 [Candidatus Moanabacter tarae]
MDETAISQRNLSPNYDLQVCNELEARLSWIEKVVI